MIGPASRLGTVPSPMSRPLALAATVSAAFALVPAAASAQLPGQPPAQPAPAPAPAPKPPPAKPGKAKIKVVGGMATKKLRYYVRGSRILVKGTVRPFVPGQTATLQVIRKGKVVKRIRSRIRKARRGGKVSFRHRAGKKGFVRFRIRHQGNSRQATFQSRSKRVKVGAWQAGAGARGTHVLLLQRGLQSLGYAVPISGSFDGGTSRAVLAFRKVNDMGRDGFATKGVFSRVFQGKGRFKLRYPKAGKHVEFDWSRQVLVLAQKGKAWRTYHISSGTSATPTVFGSFRFYRKQPGTNSKNMVHSNYFIRGYAIHGYPSVPNHPASHGCIRIPIPSAAAVNAWISLGDRIFVYR